MEVEERVGLSLEPGVAEAKFCTEVKFVKSLKRRSVRTGTVAVHMRHNRQKKSLSDRF